MRQHPFFRNMLLLLLVVTSGSMGAQIPNGYYNNATGKTGDELKSALHDIIKDHTAISYQQIWTAFWSTDNKGNNVVWDMYSDGAGYTYNYYSKVGDQCGEYEQEGDCYNREHSWPKSWFGGDEQTIPGRDLHHIFPTDGFVNAQRSSYPYGEVNNATWTSQNGSKLGKCKSSLNYTGTVFEPIDEYKGDFARALMYMSVRYYSEDSDWGSSGMTEKSVIKPWAIAMLLDWSDNDPVSQKEIDRNEVVYGIQGNRNPFIDHPEYAHIIWEPGWTGVTYNIACASVQHGSIAAPSTAVEGTMVSLAATPAQGYMLGSWNVYKTGDTNTTVAVSSNGTFTMPSFNVTVSANFVQNTTYYAITQGSVSHGSITVSANNAQSGTTITLGNTPANGYVLYSYYVYKTGHINTIVYSGTGNTFTMPAFDVTVSASFVQPSSYSYVKVTETPTDWSGEYLIVYEGGSKAFNGGLTTLDATNNTISVTINDNAIASTTTTNAAKFTIAKSNNNYTIKSASGYYIGRDASSNGLNANQTTQYLNTLGLDASNNAVITGAGSYQLRFNSNSNEMRFRYYNGTQQPIQLYKKTGSTSAAPTHTIQFNPNGGSQSSYSQTVNEFEPTALQANTFTRQGYAFDSWNTTANGTGTTYFDGATVTLLNDLTLYAQWNPLYTITCASVEYGSISASATEAVEGAFITLTATPDANYEFVSWIVTANDQPVEVEDNQFVMPAGNVTVSATFIYVEPFVQKYHLVTSTDQLVAGRTYLIVNTDNGKALGKTQNQNNRSAAAVTIENNAISTLGNACELTLGGQAGAWTFFDASNNSGYLYAAGGNNTNNYLKTQTTLTDAGKWTISLNGNKATIRTIDSNVNRHTIMYNKSNNIFSCYASGQQDVCLFILSEEYDHTESETIANLFSFDKHTVRHGATLTVTGTATCNDATHLIIKDGGQLITNDAVQATVQKYIKGRNNGGGWNFIASPIFFEYSPTTAGMIAASETDYALFRFNPNAVANAQGQTNEWENYKIHASDFSLEVGHGYLYANNNDVLLEFSGEVNNPEGENLSYDYDENSASEWKEWHLIGNPYMYEAYPNISYYIVNGSGIAEPEVSGKIAPCEGIMIKGTDGVINFTKDPQSNFNPGKLQMTVAQQIVNRGGSSTGSETVDKAIISFNEGSQLEKFYFGNPSASLYIPQNGKDYAIATVDRDAPWHVSTTDVNFKAAEKGTYTLTVSPEGVEMTYLHLIDNMTGADVDLLALRHAQGPATYTFNAKTTDYENRFKLVFAAGASTGSATDETFAFFSNGHIIINGTGTLQVIDMMGRMVLQGDAMNRVSTGKMAHGVYVLRLINGNDVKTQKIVVR